MCGINGVWLRNSIVDEDLFVKMRDSLIHRGPDDAGVWYGPDKNVALGHRRLSFMDLSPDGRQPMISSDNRVVISINGEIYNYKNLKEELQALGYVFNSGSDSEVIIHAWIEWGCEMLPKIDGMFAISLYDRKTKEILLARDRFGIKPLYYSFDRDRLYFASEIKAILVYAPELKIIKPESLSDYFTYRYIPSPGTIYKDVYKLEPAQYLIYKDGELISREKYWRPDFNMQKISQNEISKQLKSLFNQSVMMHTQSHVDIGSFLSGGYDSSAIVASLREQGHKVNTFSIGFDNWDNSEDQYAKTVADHLDMPHFSKKVNTGHLDLLDKLMYHYDEPIADISIIPTFLVSEMAVQYNKAVLSGEGADELFAGYTWHYENLEKQKHNKKLFSKKLIPEPFSVESYSYAMAMGHMRNSELQDLFTTEYSEFIRKDSDWFYRNNAVLNPGLNRFRNMDMRCFMGELVLTKIDRASMANSLEVRVPFLENNLVDFLLKVPPGQLYRKGYKKFQLYQIIKDQLPEKILNRNKQGFVGPDKYYQDADWYRQITDNSRLIKNGIIRNDGIERLFLKQEFWKLWKFAVLEIWYRKWIDQ